MKRLAVILLLALGAARFAAPIDSPAFAQSRQSWDGTWAGGWTVGTGTQITFVGDHFISIYWGDDYVEDATGSVSPDGAKATIKWSRGEAVLTRDGPTSVRVTVSEQGRPPVSFALKKD
ncbi:MAG: hypothetical protein ABSC22_15240 [Roseiarcus sp.]|jgi:hypothetical protein